MAFRRPKVVATFALLGLNCFRVMVGLAALLAGPPFLLMYDGAADTVTKIAKIRMMT